MPDREGGVFGGNRMSQSPKPSLSSHIQGEIGVRLRALHEQVVNEVIPERFDELLKRLDGRGPPSGVR